MKATFLDFLRICLVLAGVVFFMNADALNSYSNTCAPAKEGETSETASFLAEAEGIQKQHALLPAIETEHRIQEENRATDRPDKTNGESNQGFCVCTLLDKDTPAKKGFLLLFLSVPIFLFVRSLRL